jgi:hypothetical protein
MGAREPTVRQTKPWITWVARCGFVAKGIVYATIGLLAVEVALGQGGQTTGTKGALLVIAGQPLGVLLLLIVALGLLAFALWRVLQAVLDPDGAGADVQGLARRLGLAVGGLAYAGLALFALRLIVLGGAQGGDGQTERALTARALGLPYGRWLIVAAALIVIALAVGQIYIAFAAKFRDNFKLMHMSSAGERWVTNTGRVGLSARALVLGVIGALLFKAALQADPSEAGGLGQALQTLASQPYGAWVLGLVALGFLVYGAFSVLQAIYRQT